MMVSVVIPTFQRNDFLERAINSVFKQNFTDYEILIIDDNVGENVYRINNRNLENKIQNSKIRFIYNEKNLGGAEARNIGIKEAQGKYIAFLDDDDIFLPEKLKKMISVLEEKKGVMAYSFVKSNLGQQWKNVYNGNALFELFKVGSIAATSQWIILRKALIEVGGFDNTPAKQDSILTCKLLENGNEIICIEEFLSVYFEHEFTRISTSGKTLIGEINLFNKYKSIKDRFSIQEQKEIELNFNYRIFKYKIKMKKYVSASQNLFNIVRNNPFKGYELIKKDFIRGGMK